MNAPTSQPNQAEDRKAALAERAKPIYEIDGALQARLVKRGADEAMFNTLKSSLYPGASNDSILLVLDYCKARKLDPMKKVAHIVPMWDGKAKAMRDVIMPGIAEIRTTAMRTGEYAGCDGEEFGPTITLTLSGIDYIVPEWCRYTIHRLVAGHPCRFVGPKVYWREAYSTAGKDTEAPNAMWRKRPAGQLSKCAEAAALRMAFPDEVGSDYAAEEMEGKELRDVTPQQPSDAPKQSASMNAIVGEEIKPAADAGGHETMKDVTPSEDGAMDVPYTTQQPVDDEHLNQ